MVLSVKRNINTLEYPVWTPIRYPNNSVSINGYGIHSRVLPSSFDIDILNFLLGKAQLLNTNIISFKSMYSLLREINLTDTRFYYNRVKLSLDIWNTTILDYKGNFYDSKMKDYIDLPEIGIIKNTKNRNEIIVEFHEKFFEINSNSYSITLSINLMRDMPPYTKRLYEILCKSFWEQEVFPISVDKLSQKMLIINGRPLLYKRLIDKLNDILENNNSKQRFAMNLKDKSILMFRRENEFS